MKKRLIQVIIMFTLLFTTAFAVEAADSTSYYDEDYRPQYHFTPEANWMNDPNGWYIMLENIICSINTIHTGFSAPCIGACREQRFGYVGAPSCCAGSG